MTLGILTWPLSAAPLKGGRAKLLLQTQTAGVQVSFVELTLQEPTTLPDSVLLPGLRLPEASGSRNAVISTHFYTERSRCGSCKHCPKSPIPQPSMRSLGASLPQAKTGGVRQPVFLSKADRLSLTYRKTHSEVSDKAAQSASNQESRNLYAQV